jgi:preprotein translocase subunit SecY
VVLTINVAVLLAVIIILRLRRRTQARKRSDEQLTVVIVLVFGVLIAPTAFGQWILDVVGQLAKGVTNTGGP